MIWNYVFTFPNGTAGADQLFINTSSAVPSLAPFILLFIFLFVFLGGVTRQKAKIGTADYPAWATVASLSAFITALLMSLVAGFIRLEWLVITVVITIFSGVWLFLDKKPSEV